jgi:hypothetical protein
MLKASSYIVAPQTFRDCSAYLRKHLSFEGVLQRGLGGAKLSCKDLLFGVEGASWEGGQTIAIRPWTIKATWERSDGWETEEPDVDIEVEQGHETLAWWLMGSKVDVWGGCKMVPLPSYYMLVINAQEYMDVSCTMALAHSFIINSVKGNDSPVPPGALLMYV